VTRRTLCSLQLVPADAPTPNEPTFFLALREQILNTELRIAIARIELPGATDLAKLTAFTAVQSFANQP
jgi:hypothetical protein